MLHRKIRLIVLNGSDAEKYFLKYVADVQFRADDLRVVRLPSSSGARAMNLAEKARIWRVHLPIAQ